MRRSVLASETSKQFEDYRTCVIPIQHIGAGGTIFRDQTSLQRIRAIMHLVLLLYSVE